MRRGRLTLAVLIFSMTATPSAAVIETALQSILTQATNDGELPVDGSQSSGLLEAEESERNRSLRDDCCSYFLAAYPDAISQPSVVTHCKSLTAQIAPLDLLSVLHRLRI